MTYSSEVLADAPLFYGRLNEASGTVMADSSGNGRNGTYSGSVTLAATGLLTGDTDKAVTIAGAGGGQVPFASWMTQAAVTVEAIVKPSSVASFQNIVSRYDGANPNLGSWELRTDNGLPGFWWFKSGYAVAQSATALTVGSVYHVVGTYDGANIKMYVNGVLKTTTAAVGAAIETNQPLSVGGLGQPYNGTLDEVAFYGTALSATRISAHYAAMTAGGALPSLSGVWGLVA